MDKMARRISRTGSATIDLSTLVATAFIDCEVVTFQLKATDLHYLVGSNPKSVYTYVITWTLKTKFQTLKAQGRWSSSDGRKLDTEGDMAGLKLAMHKLVESHKRG